MNRRVVVTVPATTANLGPGFDCLGLALSLHNRLTLEAIEAGLSVSVQGEGAATIPADAGNLAWRAADLLFAEVGRRPPGLRLTQENGIPAGSGLGSSAAAVVGGLVAANALIQGGLDEMALLRLATRLEGHPDNVAPALLGGLVLVALDGEELVIERISIPSLQAVVVLPTFDLSTAAARAALPRQVPHADAVFNAGRLGLLLRALEAGDYGRLGQAMQDRLHQPYRLPLIPGMAGAFAAARAAGAAAVALSGAGPGVIALARDNLEPIAQAMSAAFSAAGLPSRWWRLTVEPVGATWRLNPTPLD